MVQYCVSLVKYSLRIGSLIATCDFITQKDSLRFNMESVHERRFRTKPKYHKGREEAKSLNVVQLCMIRAYLMV
jgi:hypothetical protein